MNTIKISLLLGAALLAGGCVTESKYKGEVATANTLSTTDAQLTALNQKLTAQLSADTATIQQLDNQLKVTMDGSVLFSEGGYTINAAGEKTLSAIAPTLAALKGPQIAVQAFTDNEPIGGALKKRFPSNLELSSARADDVVRYLTAKGVPSSIMSAQGFGDQRPVAPNTTAAGRAQNRRVEIVITNFTPQ